MKYFKISLLLFGLLCQSFSCQPPIPPVVSLPQDTTPKPLWTIARDAGAGVYGWFPQFIHGNNLITYTKKNGRAYIIALNKETGQEVWVWSDLFTSQEEAKSEQVHIFENILVWRSVRRVYAINLLNGQTVWKQNVISNAGFRGNHVIGCGNQFIFNTWNPVYFIGNTQEGNIQNSLNLNVLVKTNHAAPQIFLNIPPNFVAQADLNDTLAVLPYETPVGETAGFITLYNLTKNKEIYTHTMVGDTSGAFSQPPCVHNSKIYSPSGPVILCFDLKTGNELWRTRFSSITTSALLIVNNKIYSTNENNTTYCLDPETGKILWQTRTRGGASKPFFMNGVIYFTSIADGHLYGLDADTGAILMKIDDPRGGIGFGDMVAGADGKIYANTYTHLYCFKAAR